MWSLLRLVALGGEAKRFLGDERGNIVILFSLALIPLLLLAGGAVDYSRASSAKAKFNAAADAAALSAVNLSMTGKSAGSAEATAIDVFNSNAARISDAKVVSVDAKVVDNNNSRSAVVNYTASVDAAFLGLLGKRTIAVSSSATAVSGQPTFIDFYLLLDNTPSMGVGATMADINKLVANTPDKCAFACHDLSTTPNDYYGLAKKLDVQMRIDVVRQATQRLMDTAAASLQATEQYGMAIYTFGAAATKPGLTTIQSLTTNLSNARTEADKIDLMTIPYQNYAADTLTDFGDVFTDLNAVIGTPGNGTSAGSRQKYVFFVSDGVADRAVGSPACSRPTTNGSDPKTGKTYVRCQEPLGLAVCDAMKKREIKIAVLYTTYLPLPSNSWYTDWIAPFSSKIATRMESCASPGLYFEVSPTDGISEAMTALFHKVIQQARLTK
ncbi:pilus assembly protein TadG-related protein [Xanthobacteraceae bacterium Astr-EGSB]|uniref:pilus assembly protein TadG-related protein n=1 Tax=Astrobacterium formosum TaxID=3069710 RepID=UPI0027B6E865|nr:pilus assembly protein TadG-related protein [Xanthobacteraceae bacterium Astr-EGSB]